MVNYYIILFLKKDLLHKESLRCKKKLTLHKHKTRVVPKKIDSHQNRDSYLQRFESI